MSWCNLTLSSGGSVPCSALSAERKTAKAFSSTIGQIAPSG